MGDNVKILTACNEPKNELRIHLSISELCEMDKHSGVTKAMDLIRNVGVDRPDVCLVGYLSVIDICLEREDLNNALAAFLEIKNLGSVMEVKMAEKFIKLAAKDSNLKAIDAVMTTQRITPFMMAAVAQCMARHRALKKYAEYMDIFLHKQIEPKPLAVAKVHKYFGQACQEPETASKLRKEDFMTILAIKTMLDTYYNKYLNDLDQTVEAIEANTLESVEAAVNMEDDEDVYEDASAYSIRGCINDLNASNVHTDIDLENVPEELKGFHHDVTEEDWLAFSNEVQNLTTAPTKPTMLLNFSPSLEDDDISEDGMMDASDARDSDLEQLLGGNAAHLPDNFSIPVGEVVQNGKSMILEMHFVRAHHPVVESESEEASSTATTAAMSVDQENWDEDDDEEDEDSGSVVEWMDDENDVDDDSEDD